jgi:DNA-binding MarR family transcriptional regulator
MKSPSGHWPGADLNPASVTTMVDQLEAAGLVRRRRDTHDRRQCWVSLTDAGRQQVAEKERYWRARMAVAYSDITPEELAAAIKVIERTAASMERLGDDAAYDKAQAPPEEAHSPGENVALNS